MEFEFHTSADHLQSDDSAQDRDVHALPCLADLLTGIASPTTSNHVSSSAQVAPHTGEGSALYDVHLLAVTEFNNNNTNNNNNDGGVANGGSSIANVGSTSSDPDPNNISALIFATPLLAASSDQVRDGAGPDGGEREDDISMARRMLETLVVDVPQGADDDEEDDDDDDAAVEEGAEDSDDGLIFECSEHKKMRKNKYLRKDEETGLYHCTEESTCKSACPSAGKKKRAKKKAAAAAAASASGSSINAGSKTLPGARSSGRSYQSLPVSSSTSSRYWNGGNNNNNASHPIFSPPHHPPMPPGAAAAGFFPHPQQLLHHHPQHLPFALFGNQQHPSSVANSRPLPHSSNTGAAPPPPPPAYAVPLPPQQQPVMLVAAPTVAGPSYAFPAPSGYPLSMHPAPPTAYMAYQQQAPPASAGPSLIQFSSHPPAPQELHMMHPIVVQQPQQPQYAMAAGPPQQQPYPTMMAYGVPAAQQPPQPMMYYVLAPEGPR